MGSKAFRILCCCTARSSEAGSSKLSRRGRMSLAGTGTQRVARARARAKESSREKVVLGEAHGWTPTGDTAICRGGLRTKAKVANLVRIERHPCLFDISAVMFATLADE